MALGRDEDGLRGPQCSATDQIKFPHCQRSCMASGIPALKPTSRKPLFFFFLRGDWGAILVNHGKN